MQETTPNQEISLAALKEGDEEEWKLALDRLWRTVWSGARLVLSNATHSELEEFVSGVVTTEVVPQILDPSTKSFRKADSFDDVCKIAFSVAKMRAIDEVRKLVVRSDEKNRAFLSDRAGEADPETQMLQFEQIALVREAIELLSDRSKEVLLYHYMEGLKTAEIAKKVNRPVGTIYNDLFVARRSLKEEIEKLGGAEFKPF